jgi:RNA polymerase sigma-70 factor (ECF subfamily)
MPSLPGPGSRLLATRNSLIDRLPNWDDRAKWQEFFDTYWRLIYGVARKSGLSDAESQDVVQETVLSVARNISRYDRNAGSFKSWLMQLTRWRIVDQVRKRGPAVARGMSDGTHTATIDCLPDPAGRQLESLWDDEWRQTLFQTALDRVKKKVNAKHFQIFDCIVLKKWSPAKVASTLGVNVAQVYLIKHRIAGMLKREVAALERGAAS